MKKLLSKYSLIILLLASLFLRFYRLGFPKAYVFDEVYHAFTAKEYLKGSKEAWEWWTTPPPGVAYEWTHPPLAKEVMAASMWLFKNTDPLYWRIPGALLGVIAVYLIFLLGQQIFKNQTTAFLSALLFSVDGLNFVQSRTGMNDIYVVTFILASLLFFLRKRFIISAVFLGLAVSSKWSAFYLPPILFIIWLSFDLKKVNKKFLKQKLTHIYQLLPFVIIPPLIYLLTYLPFFLLGHSWSQFVELQRQMYYYHTHLKAHHDYSSSAWSWPFNLYPVWYYVQYGTNTIANIFTSGNPILFWGGLGALLLAMWQFAKTRSKKLLIPLLGYLVFWFPWIFSPRIMFLYHYSPSVPFLSLIFGYELSEIWTEPKARWQVILIVLMVILGFLAVYPFLTGIPLPKDWVSIFFRFNLAKNPFGS